MASAVMVEISLIVIIRAILEEITLVASAVILVLVKATTKSEIATMSVRCCPVGVAAFVHIRES